MKLQKFAYLILFLNCYFSGHALPVGNPSDPGILCDGLFFEGSCCLEFCDPGASWCQMVSSRAGYYGDFVFQRSLEADTHENHSFIEDTEIFTNAGLLIMNFWDRIDLFATFGASNIEIRTNIINFSPSGAGLNEPLTLITETSFSWSIGARAILWQCGCTTIGAEAQYFYTRPHIERLTVYQRLLIGATDSVYPDDQLDVKYREWQFGLGISHRIASLIPYAAIKWSHAKVDLGDAAIFFFPETLLMQTIFLPDLRSRKDVGYALGVSLICCEKMNLTVEARFADEKALHLSGQIRF